MPPDPAKIYRSAIRIGRPGPEAVVLKQTENPENNNATPIPVDKTTSTQGTLASALRKDKKTRTDTKGHHEGTFRTWRCRGSTATYPNPQPFAPLAANICAGRSKLSAGASRPNKPLAQMSSERRGTSPPKSTLSNEPGNSTLFLPKRVVGCWF